MPCGKISYNSLATESKNHVGISMVQSLLEPSLTPDEKIGNNTRLNLLSFFLISLHCTLRRLTL